MCLSKVTHIAGEIFPSDDERVDMKRLGLPSPFFPPVSDDTSRHRSQTSIQKHDLVRVLKTARGDKVTFSLLGLERERPRSDLELNLLRLDGDLRTSKTSLDQLRKERDELKQELTTTKQDLIKTRSDQTPLQRYLPLVIVGALAFLRPRKMTGLCRWLLVRTNATNVIRPSQAAEGPQKRYLVPS